MKTLGLAVCFLFCLTNLYGQSDSVLIHRVKIDTDKMLMNMDAIYNRPFLKAGNFPLALGGYVEANSSYFATDGLSDGLSFQIPQLNFIMSYSLKDRIKFLTEIQFQNGAKTIAIEYAAMDINFHSLFNLRGGVILNPIGSFNQNHDGPKQEFISRPISSTTIIPATWCNIGFGVFGKYKTNNLSWAYEAYMTNGFDNHIIGNAQNRTWLAATKENPNRFEESFNGVPLVTLKTAILHRKVGELGISWMGGIYNQFQKDGVTLDERRRIDMMAIDFKTVIPVLNTAIRGEYVLVAIDIPSTYTQQFGNRQQGWYFDVVQPILRKKMLGWDDAVLNLNFRAEFADYNLGTFTETGDNISDHVIAVVPGISFRPSPQTIIRANYRYHWETDLLGNPPIRVAGFQFGFATYF